MFEMPPFQKGESRKIILILGGSDKGLDMSKLVEEIPKFCKVVFLLPGSGSEKLKAKNEYDRGEQFNKIVKKLA